LPFPAGFGTIGPVGDHRIRLTDEDIALIASALTARLAMAGPVRAHRIKRLTNRLLEGVRGNPKWRLDEFEQTHEEDLNGAEELEVHGQTWQDKQAESARYGFLPHHDRG
jgi:hypothetical protein